MLKQRSQRPFEVYCNHCNVSFPVGARHCLHCGGRLARERAAGTAMRGVPPELQLSEAEPIEPFEEETSRRSPFSPVALIWVLLFVVGTIYRACTEG
jgi:hypothetical protein